MKCTTLTKIVIKNIVISLVITVICAITSSVALQNFKITGSDNVFTRPRDRSTKYTKIADSCVEEFPTPDPETPSAFSRVGGLSDVKRDLQHVIVAMRHPNIFFDGSFPELCLPRRILLCGAPGTGKTLLARALAQDAGANFVSITTNRHKLKVDHVV